MRSCRSWGYQSEPRCIVAGSCRKSAPLGWRACIMHLFDWQENDPLQIVCDSLSQYRSRKRCQRDGTRTRRCVTRAGLVQALYSAHCMQPWCPPILRAQYEEAQPWYIIESNSPKRGVACVRLGSRREGCAGWRQRSSSDATAARSCVELWFLLHVNR
jgi:hypothetical protein